MANAEARKRGATIDWSARLARDIRHQNDDLRAYVLLRSAGRGDEAAEVFQRIVDRAAELETRVLPNL